MSSVEQLIGYSIFWQVWLLLNAHLYVCLLFSVCTKSHYDLRVSWVSLFKQHSACCDTAMNTVFVTSIWFHLEIPVTSTAIYGWQLKSAKLAHVLKMLSNTILQLLLHHSWTMYWYFSLLVYADLWKTGMFERMTLQTDEDEHSIEMHLPYTAKAMER